jgi:hypothetical protein
LHIIASFISKKALTKIKQRDRKRKKKPDKKNEEMVDREQTKIVGETNYPLNSIPQLLICKTRITYNPVPFREQYRG